MKVGVCRASSGGTHLESGDTRMESSRVSSSVSGKLQEAMCVGGGQREENAIMVHDTGINTQRRWCRGTGPVIFSPELIM